MRRLLLYTAIATTAMYLYAVIWVGGFLLNDLPRSRIGSLLAVWILTIALFFGPSFGS